MIRWVFVVALFATATCTLACGSSQRLPELFESTSSALRRGELGNAQTLAEEGIAESARRSDALWTWKFRLLRAEALLASSRPTEVASLLSEPLPEGREFAWVRAKRKYVESRLAFAQGPPSNAVELLHDTVQLAERESAPDVGMDAEVFLGQVLLRVGRGAEAEGVLTGVVNRAARAGDRLHEASALLNLGMGRIVRGRFDEALPYFERIITFTDLTPQLVYAGALINAGMSYARLGEFDRAIDVLERAVSAQEQGGSRAYLQQALGEMGNAYLLSGGVAEGIPHLERALQVAKDSQRTQDGSVWAASLASAHIDMEQWDRAAAFNDEAQRLGTDSRNRPYQIVNEAQIAEGRRDVAAAARSYREALDAARDDPAIRWLVHAGLGRLDMAAGRRQEGFKNYEAALGIVERTRLDLSRTDHKLSIQARLLRLYREYVDLLVQRGETASALVVADFSRARVLAERHGGAAPGRPSADMFRRAASDLQSVLLFYWIGATRSYAWLVTRDRVHFVPLAVSGPDVDRLVLAYRKQTLDALGDPLVSKSPSDELYAQLIAPVAEWIPKGSRVVVVPDRALNTLNFETLPVPGERRHYWIEDVEIAVAPSLGTLTAGATTRERRDPSVLLVGDPVSADPQYPKLRYASAEIEAVSNAFPGRASIFRADRATPGRYREAKPERFSIVHFTAHASANAESPLDSAVILSRDGSEYKLYARDVAEQALSADLVTISACRSAGERAYAGEGLVGFAWAFLRAGAQRVIAGLWDVDDRSTADLMGRVYSQIAQGRSPAAALRTAKLEMIARGGAASKPYYWGPFQLFIGSRVIP